MININKIQTAVLCSQANSSVAGSVEKIVLLNSDGENMGEGRGVGVVVTSSRAAMAAAEWVEE